MTKFGTLPDGDTVDILTLANGPARATVMTYGATLTEYRLDGIAHSLALGSPDLNAYLGPLRYFGAVVGPVANRVAKARAPLGDRVLALEPNEGETILHGGPTGTGQRNWALTAHDKSSATFELVWPDGDGGFPGPLTLTVRYALEADGALRIEMTGRADGLTFCNPAFHGYWSLDGTGTLTGHRLQINASRYTPVDAALIPNGPAAPVAGTGYDLRTPTALPTAEGLDTNFCLDGDGFRQVATLATDAVTMAVETDAPGLQVYDGARMTSGDFTGHDGQVYGPHGGIALEPQHWPDAPNHPDYPPITLAPGDTFRQTSRFRFSRT